MKTMRYLLLVGLLALLCAFPALAGEAEYEGYLVKLNHRAPRLLSAEDGDDLLVVDSLEDALDIPAEYVEYIEPNYLVELFDHSDQDWQPSDPHYQQYQWGLQEMDVMTAWQAGFTGKGVKVGFVDSGVNGTHEDLNAQNITGMNFNKDGLPYNTDNYGHGTFAMGIVAAQTDNALGLAGIAPDAQMVAYRVFSNKSGTIYNVVAAIDQAVADGCQVLNLSMGTASDSQTLREAVQRAVDAGMVVVAAVGNSGTATLQYPAAYEGVIGVGSVGPDLTVSSFSQRNNTVFVTAPGEQIAGLDYADDKGYLLDLNSNQNRGTSYAAPVVTAMAALALSYDPELTAGDFCRLLEDTAIDLGTAGYDVEYGHGLVNIEDFLEELTRFNVTYELAGGQLPEGAPDTFCFTDSPEDLPVPVRADYRFTGWYLDAECTRPIETILDGAAGTRTLYAGWQVDANRLTGYVEGEICYLLKTDGLLLAAVYDELGSMRSIQLLELSAGEGSVSLTRYADGLHLRVFLLGKDGLVPLCLPLTVLEGEGMGCATSF